MVWINCFIYNKNYSEWASDGTDGTQVKSWRWITVTGWYQEKDQDSQYYKQKW